MNTERLQKYPKSISVSHIMVAVVSCYLSNGWAAIFLSSWLCNWW